MNWKIAALTSCLVSTCINAKVIEPPMVKIPSGDFMMGSDNGKDNEKPVHAVSVDTFYAGKYEVTVWLNFASLSIRRGSRERMKAGILVGAGTVKNTSNLVKETGMMRSTHQVNFTR